MTQLTQIERETFTASYTVPAYVMNDVEQRIFNDLVQLIEKDKALNVDSQENILILPLFVRYLFSSTHSKSNTSTKETTEEYQKAFTGFLRHTDYSYILNVTLATQFLDFFASYLYFNGLYKAVQVWLVEHTANRYALTEIITNDFSKILPRLALRRCIKNPIFDEDLLLLTIEALDHNDVFAPELDESLHTCFALLPDELLTDDVLRALSAHGFMQAFELENVYRVAASRLDPEGLLPRSWIEGLISVTYTDQSADSMVG